MKVIIIGNGLAAVTTASNILNLDDNIDIEIFTEEKYPYYSRVRLIDFMVGDISLDDLIVYDEHWYESRGIELHLETRVTKVEPKNNKIIAVDVNDESKVTEHVYDTLVIASGSKPIIPMSVDEKSTARVKTLEPIHRNKEGWHVLRTIDDAIAIHEHLKQAQRVVILGSGLLGLEIANKLREGPYAKECSVIEIEEYIAPVYLDKQGAFVLLNLLERAGIKVLVQTEVMACIGEKHIEGCRLADKTIHKGDMVIFACGIKPNVDFLVGSGIEMIETYDYPEISEDVSNPEITRSILVNEHLQTNIKNIYAVGDCCEFNGYLYGINPAAIEQAKHCAYNIVKPDGKTKKYEGTIPSVSFRGFDTEMISIGRVNEYTIDPDEWENIYSYYKVDMTLGEYKKALVYKDRVIGAILIGNTSSQMDIRRLIIDKIDVSGFEEKILQENFRLSDYI
ncbi:MAG: NAD(P)/FAD-dependent oxidoreductase [Promethearchaeota archaeon]